ncbi:MAG: ABC transporter ATP-binding protein, partial [Phycisphaerae bacterium]
QPAVATGVAGMLDIRIEQLSKRFGSVVAVDDVTLAVEPGELFFVLGPSGCGKTTLLRCLAGFCQPDAGRIYFGRRDITEVPAHRRNTAMVFQNYALWPHMTVAQNVGFGLQVRGVGRQQRRREVGQALAMVEMEDLADRKPNELSGGQQQRVALARALVVRPECLLLDEPLSNLDAKLRLQMRGEIRRICKQAGLTTIYVTHDQAEALSIADRIAILRDGRVEQVGPPRQLYERPANRFVAGFLGETNFIAGTVVGSDGRAVVVSTSIGPLRSSTCQVAGRPDKPVVCSIRPESIRLESAPQTAVNRVKGRIVRTVYLGQFARYVLAVGSVQLSVVQLRPQGLEAHDGQEVSVWIEPADVVVLADRQDECG